MRRTGTRVMDILRLGAERAGVEATVVGDPVLFDIVFKPAPVINYRDTLKADATHQNVFNRVLREEGNLKAPMKFYASLGYTNADLDMTEHAISKAFAGL